MAVTQLHTMDFEHFRGLVSAGERGMADRLGRQVETVTQSEKVADAVREALESIERQGRVAGTGSSREDEALNLALWLMADEAGIDAPAGPSDVEHFEEASHVLSRRSWFRKPLLAPDALDLFDALHRGRIYGGSDEWASPTRTAILDPGEVRILLGDLSGLAQNRPRSLTSTVQDLLDRHVFPAVETAARAQLGLFALRTAG